MTTTARLNCTSRCCAPVSSALLPIKKPWPQLLFSPAPLCLIHALRFYGTCVPAEPIRILFGVIVVSSRENRRLNQRDRCRLNLAFWKWHRTRRLLLQFYERLVGVFGDWPAPMPSPILPPCDSNGSNATNDLRRILTSTDRL